MQEELATAAGGLPGEIVHGGGQLLRLNPTTIASDVEVFLTALARAKAARGADRIAAAEEALAKRVSGLLLNVPRERVLVGRTIEIYRWLDLPHWERAAGRLEALGREAAVQLGRAYRDGGRYDAAMVLYGQLLGEVPHDRRVQEGLLLAARGTGDCTQLSQVWQQVRRHLRRAMAPLGARRFGRTSVLRQIRMCLPCASFTGGPLSKLCRRFTSQRS